MNITFLKYNLSIRLKYRPHITFGIRHKCGMYIYNKHERRSHTCTKYRALVNKNGVIIEISGALK